MARTEHKKVGYRQAAKSPTDGTSVIAAKMWEMVDTLRGSMNAAEYKHIVLGLIFLKHASDAFEDAQARLGTVLNADPEDPNEYRAQNIFWVPPEGRWSNVQAQSRQPTIGQIVDCAMASIERENPAIRNVLQKNYARPSLDKTRLGSIVDLISNISVGDEEARSKDVLGRVYEYFLLQFTNAEGKKGGEFYTPRSVVRLLVEMLQPYNGRVYDPCCGSAGMFVQSVDFIRARASINGNGDRAAEDISVYGQESNYAAWQLAKMNLGIRGIDVGRIYNGDIFHNDRHPDLKADYVLANPPFNVSEWGGEHLQNDRRWVYGTPPKDNANFAWVQHMVYHLAPSGAAGFVLSNDSMSSKQSGEGDIRRSLVEADLVDCMVALPGHLFYSTQRPACLWFLSRDRARKGRRRCEVLFVDARSMGRMLDRTHRELTGDDINRIASTYGSWRGDQNTEGYADKPGFCKSIKLDEIRKHDYILTPGRYVGAEPQPDDGESFGPKMSRLTAQLIRQQAEAKKLDKKINQNLKLLGFYGDAT